VGTSTARIAGHSRGAGMEQSSRSQMAAAWLLAVNK